MNMIRFGDFMSRNLLYGLGLPSSIKEECKTEITSSVDRMFA